MLRHRLSRLDLELRRLRIHFGLASTALLLAWAALACSGPDPDLPEPERLQPQQQGQSGAPQTRAATEEPTETTEAAATDQTPVTSQIANQEPVAEPTPADDDDWTSAAIVNLAAAYQGVQGVWTGFEPSDHPALAVLKTESGDIDSALALNFPSPEVLGNATGLSTDHTPFSSLHRIDSLEADIATVLMRIEFFEFNAILGGVDSFVVVARKGDFVFDPAGLRWSVLFVHELFHRYQFAAFRGVRGPQNLEGYPLTAENLALAALEDRALTKAISTTDEDLRATAARHFAAVRITRLTADQRIRLDNDQERFEGTARYLEHRLASVDAPFRSVVGDYATSLFTDPNLPTGLTVKDYYSFSRFYASGAAILRLLDLLGVTGVEVAIEAGQSPAEVLVEHLAIADADLEQLVADARRAYDPHDALAAASERAAETAKQEPPVFGRETDDNVVVLDMRWSR